MAISQLGNFKIDGICCALPDNKISIFHHGSHYFNQEDIEKVSKITGVEYLYHCEPQQTTADLCYSAAEELIEDLGWEKDTIDGILFISQTPDYITPATSCLLQQRLGLNKGTVALDINLGCSGYVYGLWLAAQFISSKSCKRVLLLVGDTISKTISQQDKSVSLIFSDGASATGLSYSDEDLRATFLLNTDGSGAESLIIPAGGFRKPLDETTREMLKDDEENYRSQEHIFMNGMEVFSFAVREVPKSINATMREHGWTVDEVDFYLLHQANEYMLNYIAKKAKIPFDKVLTNIKSYGNTSGASIPLLICDKFHQLKDNNSLKVVMSGFGIGLSWGTVIMELDKLRYGKIIYI